MRRPKAIAVSVVLAVLLVELAVLTLGGAGSECEDQCTAGQDAADTALVLLYVEAGLVALAAFPLGLGYLIREGVRESKRRED